MTCITGLDKLELLRRLWNNAPEGAYTLSFNESEAKEAVLKYINKFCGKSICCNLSKDYVGTTVYNRYCESITTTTRRSTFEEIILDMYNNK